MQITERRILEYWILWGVSDMRIIIWDKVLRCMKYQEFCVRQTSLIQSINTAALNTNEEWDLFPCLFPPSGSKLGCFWQNFLNYSLLLYMCTVGVNWNLLTSLPFTDTSLVFPPAWLVKKVKINQQKRSSFNEYNSPSMSVIIKQQTPCHSYKNYR